MGQNIITNFIQILSFVLSAAIIIRALMSWFMPSGGGSLGRVLMDVTEPILAPIRRVLPPVGGIDFSPILALILVQVVSSVLSSVIANSA